jgi:hypothetical protein
MTGTVVPIPPVPPFWYPRSYINRVVIDVAALVAPTFDGRFFLFKDVINVDWALRIRDNVYEWSSNRYTPDWLIDPALSSVTQFGSPVIDGFYCEVRREINNRFWYLWIQPGGLPGTEYTFYLPPPPPDYWYKGG